MNVSALLPNIRTGVIHIEFHTGAGRVASGTGFMCKGHLVTNNHVFVGPRDSTVVLAWQPEAENDRRIEVTMLYATFAASLLAGSDANNLDYAILRLPVLDPYQLHQFELSRAPKLVGDDVIVLGFPLEHRNLVVHKGAVSSLYESGPAKVIQLDISVNQSNSGGPLVDPDTGHVLGIVTRKGTGLTRMFDELLRVFDRNIVALEQARGVQIMGVDPIAVFIAGQNQMKALAHEIQRSANVGIGYAFSIEHIQAEHCMQ
jgi:Trypsin-like peptidase domain